MQANLEINTYNRHNVAKNDLVNKRQDPYKNRISKDITYKRKSICNVDRNPTHMGGGDEYLYYSRIEELKRRLYRHEITPEQYNNEIKKVQIARFGKSVDNGDIIKFKQTKSSSVISELPKGSKNSEEEEEKKESENEDKKEVPPTTTKELMNIINSNGESN